MVSLKMSGLFETYCETVADTLSVIPGFVTRNFPKLVKFHTEWRFGLKEYFVLTPFNSIGFQMNPSKSECGGRLEDAKGARVIAMSVLAGGYLSLDDAIKYLRALRGGLSCVVGVSSESHARETFSNLRECLQD